MESPKKGPNYKEMRRIALKAIGGSDSDPKADKEPQQRSLTRRIAKSGPVMPKLDSIKMPEKKVRPENKVKLLKNPRKRVAKSRPGRKVARKPRKSTNQFTAIGLLLILMVLVIVWFSFIIYKFIT